MASLTYDSGSKTFNADIAIVQTDSDSSLSKDQNIILSNLEVESKLGEEEFNDKNVVPDSRLICDFYQDSISEEPNEIKSSFKDKTTKRHQGIFNFYLKKLFFFFNFLFFFIKIKLILE